MTLPELPLKSKAVITKVSNIQAMQLGLVEGTIVEWVQKPGMIKVYNSIIGLSADIAKQIKIREVG